MVPLRDSLAAGLVESTEPGRRRQMYRPIGSAKLIKT